MAYEPGHTVPPRPLRESGTGTGLGIALAIAAVLAIIALFAFGTGGGPSGTQDTAPQPYGIPAEPDPAAPAVGTTIPDTGLGLENVPPLEGEAGGADPAPQPVPAPAD